jgi:hypothetical protein
MARTPPIDANSNFATFFARLSGKAVGVDVPALFWGTIPASKVSEICNRLGCSGRPGSQKPKTCAVKATIVGYATSTAAMMIFDDIEGCPVDGEPPVNVQAT